MLTPKITTGEEGLLWAWEGSQCRIDIDNASPRRTGWVPQGCIELGTATRSTPIKVSTFFPVPPPVNLESFNQGDSLLKKTLKGLLEALIKLSSTNQDLFDLLGDHRATFNTPQKLNGIANTIMAGIPASGSSSLCRGDFSRSFRSPFYPMSGVFLELLFQRPVSSQNAYLGADMLTLISTTALSDLLHLPEVDQKTRGGGIYLQWYQMPGNQQGLLRIGSTNNFGRRLTEHLTRSKTPDVKGMSCLYISSMGSVYHIMLTATGTHYRLARQSTARRMVVLCHLAEDESLFMTAENSFVILMGSYLAAVTAASLGDEFLGFWAGMAADATLLMRVGNNVFQKTGWSPASDRLSLRGINMTSPWSENHIHERTLWTRQDGPGFMTFRRPGGKLTITDRKKETSKRKEIIELGVPLGQLAYRAKPDSRSGYYTVCVPTEKINDYGELHHNSLVDVVVEIRTDGQIHSRQYGRLPFIGPYSDWQECLGFAIRVEFMTSQGLRSHYVQKHKDRREVGNVPTSYAEVSNLLAAFKGNIYNTTNLGRQKKAFSPLRIVKVSFDNLNRILRLEQLANNQNIPEPTKRTFQELGQELRGKGFWVSPRKPDRPPGSAVTKKQEAAWNHRFRCDTCMAVGSLLAA